MVPVIGTIERGIEERRTTVGSKLVVTWNHNEKSTTEGESLPIYLTVETLLLLGSNGNFDQERHRSLQGTKGEQKIYFVDEESGSVVYGWTHVFDRWGKGPVEVVTTRVKGRFLFRSLQTLRIGPVGRSRPIPLTPGTRAEEEPSGLSGRHLFRWFSVLFSVRSTVPSWEIPYKHV